VIAVATIGENRRIDNALQHGLRVLFFFDNSLASCGCLPDTHSRWLDLGLALLGAHGRHILSPAARGKLAQTGAAMSQLVSLGYPCALTIASLFCLTGPARAEYVVTELGTLGRWASIAQGVTNRNAESSGSPLTRVPEKSDAARNGVEPAGAYDDAALTPTALAPEPPTLLLAGVGGICLAVWALGSYALRSLWTRFAAAKGSKKGPKKGSGVLGHQSLP
jgi:hypothetical protein